MNDDKRKVRDQFGRLRGYAVDQEHRMLVESPSDEASTYGGGRNPFAEVSRGIKTVDEKRYEMTKTFWGY